MTLGTTAGGTAPRVFMLTNLPAPYRLPVWSELAKSVRLTVGLLDSGVGGTEGTPTERAEDWRVDAAQDLSFELSPVRTWQFSVREDEYYLARPPRPFNLSTYDVAILCGWESPAYWQALASARLRRIPALGFYESTVATSRFGKGPVATAREYFFRHLDAVIVPGHAAEKSVREKGVTRVFRGFNAVDMAPFEAAANRLRRGNAEPTGKSFLFVGKLVTRKNVDAIIKAFATLPADTTLSIIGSGPEEHALRALATSLGLDDRVAFRGYVAYQDLPEAMVEFDHLVLSSHVEVWGLVVNEALAAGLHVVVSRGSGVAADVGHMRGVQLCDTSAPSIAAAMRESLASWSGRVADPEILEHMPARLAQVELEAISWALRHRGAHEH